jgi:hypothetical protein
MGMSFGVYPEVGRLQKVHRPGREHARLTPSNAEEVTTLIHESASTTTLPAILVEAPPSTSAGRRRQPAGASRVRSAHSAQPTGTPAPTTSRP